VEDSVEVAAGRLHCKLLHGTPIRKDELRALERVFEAEIAGAVGGRVSHLFQSKASIYKRLELVGLVRYVNSVTLIGGGALGSVAISGYELTHDGRLAYCINCGDDDAEPAP
jgi:hypothetical protein